MYYVTQWGQILYGFATKIRYKNENIIRHFVSKHNKINLVEQFLKLMYSEKATKFEEITNFYLKLLISIKWNVEISSQFWGPLRTYELKQKFKWGDFIKVLFLFLSVVAVASWLTVKGENNRIDVSRHNRHTIIYGIATVILYTK